MADGAHAARRARDRGVREAERARHAVVCGNREESQRLDCVYVCVCVYVRTLNGTVVCGSHRTVMGVLVSVSLVTGL